jgi:predicted glycogen debranching enzyme
VVLLSTEPPAGEDDAVLIARRLRIEERRRRFSFSSRLARAADDYIVDRGEGKTIVAGYPWFGPWGRDTFIALRGLCLAAGRLDDAREILLAWAGRLSEGMLPNRFADRGEVPEYNSVDAALWYVVAFHDFLEAADRTGRRVSPSDRDALTRAVGAILDGYSRGTRYGIRAEADGLLAAGVPGVQLTWMDARVGKRVVTPRIGKPVEIQALWWNALKIGDRLSPRPGGQAEKAAASFAARFWNAKGRSLYDVVDCGHVPGTADARFRPNQIFAVGGLPFAVLEGERARSVVDAVEARLWTPRGLRSLAADDPAYVGRYQGGVAERDGAYHQGTVWPWLAGPFVEAWVRVRGGTAAAKREARARFLEPLLQPMGAAGLGHLPEIADGDAPHAPRGCPFQAWSVGEALRLDRVVLAER